MRTAASSWGADPAAARDRLERARALDPLSDRPDQLLGAIASRRGDWSTMRLAFERALERNPHSWYAHFELALVSAVQNRPDEALRRLELAERLNPAEPLVGEVRARVLRGEPVDPDEIDRTLLERLEDRTG
jgi:tetratricopeptide (TPR) repeat protein